MLLNKLSKKIIEVNNSISEKEVYLREGLLYLIFTRFNAYENLEREILKLLKNTKEYDKKEKIVNILQKFYKLEKNKYRNILNNLSKGIARLKIDELIEDKSVINMIKEKYVWDEDKTVYDNFCRLYSIGIEGNIYNINEKIYSINKFPFLYTNNKQVYIGSTFGVRFEGEYILYKDIFLAKSGLHDYSIFFKENTSKNKILTLINIIAFFYGKPNFVLTDNYYFNRKTDRLYNEFNLLDMLNLRNKIYFQKNINENTIMEEPIFKLKNKYSIINLSNIAHEEILDLYHSSLKQFEPLPRCVFLFRVFEYGASNHYKKIFRFQEYKPENAIEYYINQALQYNPNPLYYIDSGTYYDEENKVFIKKRKTKILNFMTELKKESKKIFLEWENDKFKKNKTRGYIIYNLGRNLTAHGGNGKYNMKYDYANNYKHINNVNIILELIARYLIELLNPSLKNNLERRKSHYIIEGRYEELFN